jgi:hypothetical protein
VHRSDWFTTRCYKKSANLFDKYANGRHDFCLITKLWIS